MKKMTFFPELIDRHPGADIPPGGVNSRLIQAGQQQFVFMEYEQDIEVPAHAHEAQWMAVFDGQMELTVEGQLITLRKGDCYYIEQGMVHSARIMKGYKGLTLFDQADRYKEKKD